MRNNHTLRIERLSNSADGIAHLPDGKTVFVPGTCPGDEVNVRLVEEKARFARAELLDVLTPSPDRTEPRCPYAGLCGGCPWQQVSYEVQLGAKREQVVGALVHIGGFDTDIVEELCDPTIPSPEPWGYRNKVEFDFEAGGHPSLGLHAAQGGFMPIERCLLLPGKHGAIPKALTGAFRYLQGNASRTLDLTRVGVRVSRRTGELELALWGAPGAFPRKAAAQVLSSVQNPSSIVRVLVKGQRKARRVTGVEVLAGKGCWHERLDRDLLAFSAPSFFQVNTAAAEALRQVALGHLDGMSPQRVFDLYCGAGTFTLPLARIADEVVAIESAASSVRDLKRNLRHSGAPVRIVGGDVARELPALGPADACLVDPPRAGLAVPVIDALCEARPERIIYVSCDPATLARDLKMLCRSCYTMEHVTPVDLFPQTPHVETVVHLSRL